VTNLTFNEQTHTYYNDGQAVISVTQVLKLLSNEIYKGISRRNMNNAAERGSDIHYATDLYDEFGIEEVKNCHLGYFNGYKKFKSEWNHKAIINEEKLYSGLGYAGTPDSYCTINNQFYVMDKKTTAQFHKHLLGLQLGAYRNLLRENGHKCNLGCGLQLKPNGKYKLIFFNEKELDVYFNHFKDYLRVAKINKYYLGGNH